MVTLQAATLADFLPPRLIGPVWDGTAFNLHFLTRSNWSYTVQYSDLLPATNWQTLAVFPGNGLEVEVTDSPPLPPRRFYRVLEY